MKNEMNDKDVSDMKGVKRGDIYYVDFGTVEDAVGHEFAKRRPVLIIQNDIGNEKSPTTICLCLTSRCKYVPYHIKYENREVVKTYSDICAEQIKTIDKCRLEQYMGNVGSEVMKEVDKALVLSLGIETSQNIICDHDEEQLSSFSAFQYMQEQLEFWQKMNCRIAFMRTEIDRLNDEIESILNCIEGTNFNVVKGYKTYKMLRDKRMERKELVKEIICLETMNQRMKSEDQIAAYQTSIQAAYEEIKRTNKNTFVEGFLEELEEYSAI